RGRPGCRLRICVDTPAACVRARDAVFHPGPDFRCRQSLILTMNSLELNHAGRHDGQDLPVILGHPTMKNLIYTALRERIVFGELKHGERLVEADLATRFKVSKTPVREALLTLEAEGLVTMRAHRGAIVSHVSAEQYRDLQFT